MSAVLLKNNALVRTRDLDEARERVARVFCPHLLERLDRRGEVDVCLHHLAGERISLNYIEYGAKSLIAPGELDSFYLLQIPLEGAADIINGRARYISTPDRAAILNPHMPTRMTWHEGTRQILVQVSRKAMQECLTGALGGQTDGTLTFQGPIDLTTPSGAALKRLVFWLVAEADAGNPPIGSGLMARQIESAVVSGLLEAPHAQSDRLARLTSTPRPRHLRLAEDYIDAHLEQPLTLEDIANAAGISTRGLQLAFREWRGTTPMSFLRDARLARAHSDLEQAKPGTRITDVALRWGFTHFGRFAQLYRSRYGIAPRDTLRSADAAL